MIIGTAGHIDHGKTTLVHALTGTDTDRLKEEKARGISIELGYAYTPMPNGDVLGIIDVPGHERFIHTMASGAVGIDHALLVVAADDGVMPQTREHLAILQLLGVRSATVALTKVDRVDEARASEVEQHIHALLAPTVLGDAAIFRTAAAVPDDPGVRALRAHLLALAQAMPTRAADGFFRLAVDRVFTLAGQGTIVTGTVFGGRVAVGDTLTHSGTGERVKVRSIHAQNRASETGVAGQRCALNLVGIDKSAIARGDWIADARVLAPSVRLDARLKLLPDVEPLVQWAPVHVHIGTTHHLAHVAVEGVSAAQPGSETRLQLVFDAPVYAIPGDRFIVRNAQATRTIGGGEVLDPFAPARKRHTPQRQAYLDALERMLVSRKPGELIALAPQGLSIARVELLLGGALASGSLDEGIKRLVGGQGADDLLVAAEPWSALRSAVIEALARFHERAPDEAGVNRARLGRMVLPGQSSVALLDALLDELVTEGVLARTGPWIHLTDHRVTLAPAEQEVAERVLPRLLEGRFDPPWVRDLARDGRMPEELVRQTLRKMARSGQVFQVVKDLFYHPNSMVELAAIVKRIAQASSSGEVRAQAFRDETSLGRKRAIQILEFFDRIGYTRRLRDMHVIRPDATW